MSAVTLTTTLWIQNPVLKGLFAFFSGTLLKSASQTAKKVCVPLCAGPLFSCFFLVDFQTDGRFFVQLCFERFLFLIYWDRNFSFSPLIKFIISHHFQQLIRMMEPSKILPAHFSTTAIYPQEFPWISSSLGAGEPFWYCRSDTRGGLYGPFGPSAHTQRGGLQNDGLFGDGGYSTVSGRGDEILIHEAS